MSHFAKVENNIVTQVIVAEQDVINSGLFGAPHTWIQTSYNTHNGVHALGGTPLRKNFAGIGYYYDSVADEFLPPNEAPEVAAVTEPTTTETVTTPTASDTVTITTPTATETITLPTAFDTVTITTAFDTITLTTASETITL
jgi:hypothetical protein